MSAVKNFTAQNFTTDTAKVPVGNITVDTDVQEVDPVNLVNHVLIGVAASAQNDSASEVQIQVRPYLGPAVDFTAAAGFGTPQWDKTSSHPMITYSTFTSNARWELTARIQNAFGYSDYITPIEVAISTVPTSSDSDIASLDEFGLWTQDNPPTPADSRITGLTTRMNAKLSQDHALSSFTLYIEGSATQTFPTETLLLGQATATATATRGVKPYRSAGIQRR